VTKPETSLFIFY